MLELYWEKGLKERATGFVTPPVKGSNKCKVKNMTKSMDKAVCLRVLKKSTYQSREKNEQAAAQHFFCCNKTYPPFQTV